jgi:pimeloyl-ACP methyl ester carboxylesterase
MYTSRALYPLHAWSAVILLAAGLVVGCLDPPTSSAPANIAGSDLRTFPTGTPAECPELTTGASGTLPGSGALYLICVPPGFDPAAGSLVVYAPGTVPPQLPLTIRDDEVGGVAVSQIVTGILGAAFATTSYRKNGLVVVDATRDLQRLVARFRELYGPIGGHTYAVGVSEGGLIATLATERHSQLFDGTLAACAPIGDFQRQINYFDDFRLAFDFYFAPILAQGGIFLGSPIDIPDPVITAFGTPTDPGALAIAIAQAALSHPEATNPLFAAADIALQLGASDPDQVVEFLLRLLAYNLLYTNDTQDVVGGQPYDNVAPTGYDRVIDGLDVPSFSADQPALSHLRAMYQTSGRLKSPLVTLFNTSDPIVPSWNEAVYQSKVAEAGSTGFLVAQMGSATFGHCEFSLQEVLTAFGALVQAVTGEPLAVAQGRG